MAVESQNGAFLRRIALSGTLFAVERFGRGADESDAWINCGEISDIAGLPASCIPYIQVSNTSTRSRPCQVGCAYE